MFNDANRVLEMIGPNDRVLDVGGATEVFPRANVVLDIQPYDHRQTGQLAGVNERFSEDDWHVGDLCSDEIWGSFADREFDFVICSHTLEDVRDPLFVCRQMIRVGKAGYIETPSRYRECARVMADDPCAGWDHHRWIVDLVGGDTLVFTAKMPWVNYFDYLGERNRRHVHDFDKQFLACHWTGSFDYVERMPKGSLLEAENLFDFFDRYPYERPVTDLVVEIENVGHRGRTFRWVDEFLLPIEEKMDYDAILERHERRHSTGERPGSRLFELGRKIFQKPSR